MPIRFFLCFLFAVSLVCGCTKGVKTTVATKIDPSKVDPWAKMTTALAKPNEQSPAEIRHVLEQLNSDIANVNDTAMRPTPLTAEQDKIYHTLFPGFSAEDWTEATGSSFSKLDPAYLQECQFFRDAVASLDSADVTQLERAKLTFAWICRLIYLNPAFVEGAQSNTVLPPMPGSYVLKRGWGSGLERAYVFLAAIQQIGLDGCLIGPPGSDSKAWFHLPSGSRPNTIPPGPFWGVGIRVDKEIVVFNPWKGIPAPGATAGAIATLSQLKAKPELLKDWYTGEPGALTASIVSSSEPFLTVPIAAISPRWQMFESKLGKNLNLFIDPIALQKEFGSNVKFWCPKEGFDFSRALASFLPTEEGGRDSQPIQQLYINQNRFVQFPRSLLTVPPEVQNPEARSMLVSMTSGIYDSSFISGATPREKIARGLYHSVTPDLVEKEKKFSAAAQRYLTQQSNREPIRKFMIALNEAYNERNRELQKLNLDRLLKEQVIPYQMLIDAMVGVPAAAESTYLLAICKHEVAEQLQSRADRIKRALEIGQADSNSDPKKIKTVRDSYEKAAQNAADAWMGARDWWSRYESVREMQGKAFPGRSEHAKALADRANNPAGR